MKPYHGAAGSERPRDCRAGPALIRSPIEWTLFMNADVVLTQQGKRNRTRDAYRVN